MHMFNDQVCACNKANACMQICRIRRAKVEEGGRKGGRERGREREPRIHTQTYTYTDIHTYTYTYTTHKRPEPEKQTKTLAHTHHTAPYGTKRPQTEQEGTPSDPSNTVATPLGTIETKACKRRGTPGTHR